MARFSCYFYSDYDAEPELVETIVSQVAGMEVATCYNTLVSSSNPVKDGYIFSGWSLFDNYEPETGTYGNDISHEQILDFGNEARFLAIWEVDAPTVTFSSNGGFFMSRLIEGYKLTQVDYTGSFDGSLSLSQAIYSCNVKETPVKPSYKLAGWSTTETGSVEYLPDATPTITADTTLYAVWELRDDIGIVQLYDEIEGYKKVESVSVSLSPMAGVIDMHYLSSDTLEYRHDAFSQYTTCKVVKNSIIYFGYDMTSISGGTIISGTKVCAATSDIDAGYGTGGTAN